MKVILCGYNWAGCKSLDHLLEDGHDVFVFTHESPSYVNDVIGYCRKRKVAFSLSKISMKNLPFVPDVIVSIYYRFIIPVDVIEACDHKIFNLHPSLLPQYRGCSSLTWAMINGEKETGFTYHYIEQGIDIGRIIFQGKINIEEFDTQQSLYFRVMFEALREFKMVLAQVVKGFPGHPQTDIDKGAYYKRGCPHDGKIDESWDDVFKERFIRAMIYPPLPPATFRDKEIYSINDYKDIVSRKN